MHSLFLFYSSYILVLGWWFGLKINMIYSTSPSELCCFLYTTHFKVLMCTILRALGNSDRNLKMLLL